MGFPECLRGRRGAIIVTAAMWLAESGMPLARADGVTGTVKHPSVAGGNPIPSALVPVANGMGWVGVVPSAADGSRVDSASITGLQIVGLDPVSRVALYRKEGVSPPAFSWLKSWSEVKADAWTAVDPEGVELTCRSAGWVKQVGGKVLPLALLRIEFEGAVPMAGTPIVSATGQVVAIVFQAAPYPRTAYGIPGPAVLRVADDLSRKGSVARGWLGLAMRAEVREPRVARVLAGSPSEAAGISAGDVLLQIGERRVGDYADAVDAFFYLKPERPVTVVVRRGEREIPLTATPSLSAQ